MSEYVDYVGAISVSPALNAAEIRYLERFAGTRRMDRKSGPYATIETPRLVVPDGDIIDVNRPPSGQPGLSCQWAPTADGSHLEWNRRTKFPFAAEWLTYLIDSFLKPDAALHQELLNPVTGRYYAPEFREFTFDHVLDGLIEAQGEDGDHWQILVRNNSVSVLE
ncbi:hypothetical protein ACFYOV_31365 [Streptomyces sp. NPDC005931]|uniref:hypothetical protein n=1 Tax=Streptomyces sp. NPDC005931 TaxID=3364737 RepID=UPI003681E72C